jgi:hypothetical protein
MTDYVITGEQLMGLCLELHPDIIKDLCFRPLEAELKKERVNVLDKLKNDLKSRFISSSGNQWAKGRNSGLLECCNIIDEYLQGGEP